MARSIHVAAAQLGPVERATSRSQVVGRLIDLLEQSARRGCELVVFPELAFTTFFPRWELSEDESADFYEDTFPSRETQPLFDAAKRLRLGFSIGYAERAIEHGVEHRYNSSVLVNRDGEIIGKYRKIHLPGYAVAQDTPGQHLEKRYFEIGNLGFPVWDAFGGVLGLCICNDRRWPETYRVMALQGVEMILLGYNTPIGIGDPPELDALANFHNHLVMQAGAYQNSTWVVGVAKAGREEGFEQIGQSCIIAPSGEIVAMTATLEDEVISHRCDLDFARPYRADIFDFDAHRQPRHYQLIARQTGRKRST